ncbi:hypothetical protein NW755_007895 [Fusarium falciforme]|uniref:Uncharacterized protein n=1 Tax=Fusarium falciforme TaxID=195108 RepID=A0A9W8UYP8_9HYPO|nr:hypothetical protein NW755_007895 [Fusarium falciforme]
MPRLKPPIAICGWPADALVIDLTRQSCSSYCFSPAKHEMNAGTPLSRQHSIKGFTLPPGFASIELEAKQPASPVSEKTVPDFWRYPRRISLPQKEPRTSRRSSGRL